MEEILDIVKNIEVLSHEDTTATMHSSSGYDFPIDKDYLLFRTLSKLFTYYIKKFGFSFCFGALTQTVYSLDKKDLHKKERQSIFSNIREDY